MCDKKHHFYIQWHCMFHIETTEQLYILPQTDLKISATTGYAMKSLQGTTKKRTITDTRGGQKIMWQLTYIVSVMYCVLYYHLY
jgi:hypothetical protein